MIDKNLFDSTNEIINEGYKLLRENDEKTAIETFRPFFPCMGTPSGTMDFHFGLYNFELLQSFPDEYLNIEKYRHGKSYVRFFEKLISTAKAKNTNELIKLLEWFKGKHFNAHDRITQSELMRRFVHPTTTDRDAVKFYYKNLMDAYKDKFEITDILILIANLILIAQGKKFSEQPYKTHAIVFSGHRIHQGSHVSKGLAVGWINQNLSVRYQRVFSSAFSNTFRRLSAHSDYIIDIDKQQYTPTTGAPLKFSNAIKYVNSIVRFQKAAILTSAISQFETSVIGPVLHNIGLKDWHYVPESNTFVVFQCFANFKPNLKRKLLHVYPQTFGEKDPDVVCLGFDGTVIPYDLRVLASKATYSMLKELSKVNSVTLVINSVAPYTFPFTESETPIVNVMGQDMILISQSIQPKLAIDSDSLNTVIDHLTALKL